MFPPWFFLTKWNVYTLYSLVTSQNPKRYGEPLISVSC